jgi:Leucine-rich repeat (LRR) protein
MFARVSIQIHPGSFAQLPNLVNLSLGMNKWLTSSTSSEVFAGMTSLRYLDLHSTVANSVDAQQTKDSTALERLLGNASDWLANLEILHLEDNGLTYFPLDAILPSMPRLQELWLSNNHLDTVEFRESVMHEVRRIHIDGNNITGLSRESIANLILMNTTHCLEIVNISNNPLDCSCQNR